MTQATPKTITTREYLQRLAEKGYTVISPDVMTVQDVLSLYEQLDSLRDSLRDANEGAHLMYMYGQGGEAKLLQDWGIGEAVKTEREPYTDRKVTVPQTLQSYATYKNTGKARPLSAEVVDGERLGE